MRFITGNVSKYDEAKTIIGELRRTHIALPEIQSLDPREVITEKLNAASLKFDGPFIVEDTSLFLDCLGGFPGPLIKWLLKAVGPAGVHNLCEKHGEMGARASTIIGYAPQRDEIHYFAGGLSGRIVAPRGEKGFGWDAIFLPDGHDKTLAEMTSEEKNQISMRKAAFVKLRDFLSSQE